MTEEIEGRPVERSKSWRQARMMQEQAAEELPDGVARRVPADVAQRFFRQDLADRQWFDDNGDLIPDPAPPAD